MLVKFINFLNGIPELKIELTHLYKFSSDREAVRNYSTLSSIAESKRFYSTDSCFSIGRRYVAGTCYNGEMKNEFYKNCKTTRNGYYCYQKKREEKICKRQTTTAVENVRLV